MCRRRTGTWTYTSMTLRVKLALAAVAVLLFFAGFSCSHRSYVEKCVAEGSSEDLCEFRFWR
jgi:uncharacterized protein YgiB involved in biofilm formation